MELSSYERKMIAYIKELTEQGNLDNISRTKFYYQFYKRNTEIEWAFLASMVSRNAGWNMTDLQGQWFPHLLNSMYRQHIFNTYESANWLIFEDAFPQLMIYEISKSENKSYFHLLTLFHVSIFMQREWKLFWENSNKKRLVTALIINEQNVIQKPVIKHPFYKKKVFHSLPYLFQDWFHFSSVLFPTLDGEVFGFSVHNFTSVDERIELGKKLAWLLFHPAYYHQFKRFSDVVEHTGSRFDYEIYFSNKKARDTPYLRMVYPVLQHHRKDIKDWFHPRKPTRKWFKPIKPPTKFQITEWYRKKQNQLHATILFEAGVLPKIND